MNATKNPTETEGLDALYAKLTETETRISVLEKLLSEAKNEAESLYAEIEDGEQNAKKVKKNETAKPTAKKIKKSKKQSKKAAEIAPTETETTTETENPLKKLPVFDRPNHLVAYKFIDENGKEICRELVPETKKRTASKKKAKK